VGFAEAGPAHENDVGLVLEKGEAKEILKIREEKKEEEFSANLSKKIQRKKIPF
jgi:hypothetical protein